MDKFTIVIPVYNEAKNLKILIPKIYNQLKKKKFEVLVVDDNSKDDTTKILNTFKKKNFHHIIRKADRDLSKSCILGFQKAKYENIVVMDGDLQHKPSDIKKFLQTFYEDRPDIVVGTRDLFEDKKHNLRIKLYNEIIYQTIKGFAENYNFEKGVRFLKNNQNDSCVMCGDERADKKYMISDDEDDIKTCITCFAFLMEDFNEKHPNKIDENIIQYAKSS